MKFAYMIASLMMSSTFIFAGSAKLSGIEQYKLSKPQDISKVIPQSQLEVDAATQLASAQFEESIAKIAGINMEARTLENTIYTFDQARGLLFTQRDIFEAIYNVSPNKEVRTASIKAYTKLDQTYTDVLCHYPVIYDAILHLEKKHKDIPDNQRHFISHLKQELKQEGLGLPPKRREAVRQIKQELSDLWTLFARNINEDQSHIWVSRQELYGLPQDFIQNLETKNYKYKLTCDYPTYNVAMKLCKSSQVRKKLYTAFQNRAYPQNEPVLEAAIFKSDELAKELGYLSYADLDLSKQMIKSEDRANAFIDEMLQRVMPVAQKEFSLLTEELPDGVFLTDHGRLNAYDLAYVTHLYKKQYLDIDDTEVSEYFPLESTLNGLIAIYEAFFNLKIKREKVHSLWDKNIQTFSVASASDQSTLGYILLDLHPRANKYGHAANCPMIPAYRQQNGDRMPALTLVMTNFAHPTKDKPTLLTHREVVTIFHEFGHALHNVLGSTSLMSACGANTQIDFVEMPSQLLEQWLFEKEILKTITSHYQTHEPMPDHLVEKLAATDSFAQGLLYVKQCFLAKLALSFFEDGATKNSNMIEHKLRKSIVFYLEEPDDLHFHDSFSHLCDYGPKYYGYMWSKVFALDIYDQIKKEGILNPKAGERYVFEILSRGGVEDPNDMLENYLKRKPSMDPFIEKLGGKAL